MKIRPCHKKKMSNAALQLRRAISIQLLGTRLLEKHAIAPAGASAFSAAARSLGKHKRYLLLYPPVLPFLREQYISSFSTRCPAAMHYEYKSLSVFCVKANF